ncbi:hypothetical protein GDO86_013436 [Hymenochirus boettgeri]|uniref:Neuropeptide S n=1 Tax=Hymenochirus boettgeri TaxID=247094 RepID=A0A8T2IWT5_9PIPI|nr:hypothetical protein GDO86_013436 [Hymenochirus boettgeri]
MAGSRIRTWICRGFIPFVNGGLFWIFRLPNFRTAGIPDYCLVLLNSCLVEVDRSEELAFLKPFLEKSFMKRSFRNGVGAGIKKNFFRRAKS